jgi:eukaryotic-like serine/threonine-protein kinase
MLSDPWSTEIDKFLALVLASRLINIKGLKEACKELGHKDGAQWSVDELAPLCERLVSSNRLTLWQCKKLLNGQYKGFFVDDYKLLDYIGSEETDKIYHAEDRITKHRVRLRITPPVFVPGEKCKPYYEVEEL